MRFNSSVCVVFNMLRIWLRVIRVQFLLSSVIAVLIGLAIQQWWSWSNGGVAANINVFDAILTVVGVCFLHASVDLLNDYWDFKRGIDTTTSRTKMSGGTGVLPEGLLNADSVYRAGVVFLIMGSVIGGYFVVMYGWVIAVLLGFAIISVYFYSTRIVDSGLAEVFVAIKGAMIVMGSFFIQSQTILAEVVVTAGAVVGVLSSLVLFVASFPDHDADKRAGRKTLVVVAGPKNAVMFFWVFLSVIHLIIIIGIFLQLFPMWSAITLCMVPLGAYAGIKLRNHYTYSSNELFPIMQKTLMYSRGTGILFILSFVIAHYMK